MKPDFNIDDILRYMEDYRQLAEIDAYLANLEAEELMKEKEKKDNEQEHR